MFLVTVAEKGGGSQQIQFEKPQVTIGRLEGNDIVLSKGNVSKYHCLRGCSISKTSSGGTSHTATTATAGSLPSIKS